MSTISADASLLDGELVAQRRGNGALWIALTLSLLLHAAVVALFPSLRVPSPPQLQVLTVELQYASPSNEPEQPAPNTPAKRVEQSRKTFQRQEVAAPRPPAITPQPQAIDPRSEVAAVPRLEPRIFAGANIPAPSRDVRTQPGPIPEAAPKPQQRDERPPSELTAPARSEPKLERRAEPRPEPRTEPRVQPQRTLAEPRPVAKADPRVEPDASQMRQPSVQPQNRTIASREPQAESALTAPKTEVVNPKTEPPPTAPRVEREPDLKSASRSEPVVMARPRPETEMPAPLSAQPAPPPEPRITQPRPDNTEALGEQRAEGPSTFPRPPRAPDTTIALGSAPQAIAPTSQTLTRAPEQSKQPRPISPPTLRAPEIVSAPRQEPAPPTNMAKQPQPIAAPTPQSADIVAQLNREPAVPTNVPSPAQVQDAAPVQQPSSRREKIPEPPATLAAIQPPAKRNKADEDAAARAYATQLARLIGKSVSKRDYPRIAQDRRWEGTTQLVVRFHAGGRLSEVTVASSSGFDVLDQRAVELMNQITLPAVPTEIQSRAFAVRIPVNFTLKEQ